MKQSFFLLFVLFLLGCQSKNVDSKSNPSTSEHLGLTYTHNWKSAKGAITFMAFNVENLFDTNDDSSKNDETFLPLAKKQTKSHKQKCEPLQNPHWKDQCLNWDWSEKVVENKLKVLSQSILQVNGGRGPDILVLEEVENANILKQLNSKGLNYKTLVLIEGADKRGIDVALMSRLPQVKSAHLHAIPFKGFKKHRVQDTRGILQVDLKLPDGEILTVFGVHFPAPFHPKKMRTQAFQELNRLVDGLPKGRLAMAAGDFNVPKREDSDGYVVNITKDRWIVGHKVGCEKCVGTTYYPPQDSWSFLDMILWSASFADSKKWQVNSSSFRVVNGYAEQRTSTGAPKRFDSEGPSGVSDHWPLAVDLLPKK